MPAYTYVHTCLCIYYVKKSIMSLILCSKLASNWHRCIAMMFFVSLSHTHGFTSSDPQMLLGSRLKFMVYSILYDTLTADIPRLMNQLNNKFLPLIWKFLWSVLLCISPLYWLVYLYLLHFTLYDIILKEIILEKIKSDLLAHKYFWVSVLYCVWF